MEDTNGKTLGDIDVQLDKNVKAMKDDLDAIAGEDTEFKTPSKFQLGDSVFIHKQGKVVTVAFTDTAIIYDVVCDDGSGAGGIDESQLLAVTA